MLEGSRKLLIYRGRKLIIQAEVFQIDITRREAEIILNFMLRRGLEPKDLEISVNIIERLKSCLALR